MKQEQHPLASFVKVNGRSLPLRRQPGFLDDDFLLLTESARRLYHEYAKGMPIIDYHNHLPPQEIAQNKPFANLTQLWLAGDHYKWRAMRTLGIKEKYVTGDASDWEKFQKWAAAVPYTLRNPLYHWTHMELKNPFGITDLLSERNAAEVYAHCNKLLQQPAFTPQGLLKGYGVAMVGTTDDPTDNLQWHDQLAASDLELKVFPSFRPDKALQLAGGEAFREYLQLLSQVSGVQVTDLASLLEALQSRMDYFHARGCRLADHGLSCMPSAVYKRGALEQVFAQVLRGDDTNAHSHQDAFCSFVLLALCKMYSQKGWVQQFHVGALRDTNTRMLQTRGANTGYDSIGDYPQALNLVAFLNTLEKEDALAKTIIYNLNPADNAAFAAMTGNFQGEGIKGKIQFGAAWWFLDQLDGMKSQLDALSNMGLLSCFIGMLTDSRSFLSYSRHEYFRRLLCSVLGQEMEQGLLPNDLPWIGKLVQDIAYNNARDYFPFMNV